jgi:antitoxin component of MazEF toxin-antitoxin module
MESKEFLLQGNLMLAKVTSKNQITLPKAVMAQISPSQYFEVEAVNDRIMLTPVRMQKADDGIEAVWRQFEEMGITEQDITDAVKWARAQPENTTP